MTREKKVHYIGGVRLPHVIWLKGWPACCSGPRAYAISGHTTLNREEVTCKSCLATLRAEDAQRNK